MNNRSGFGMKVDASNARRLERVEVNYNRARQQTRDDR